MKNGIQLLIVAALAGIGLREFEAANYTVAGFAGMGIVTVATISVVRIRNHFDRKALAKG